MSELSKTYDPKQVEPRISKLWEEGDYFHAEPDDRPPEERFCVVIPPPNVTGALHLGHALNGTLQDILVRWHRMMGHNTLWMPGTDHAGIATQAVVERRIFEEEGRTRHDIGREELVKRIWQWKDEYETRIIGQLKLMGCSCDFARKRFTLDEGCSRAVRETFFKLFKDGYIVRGKRLVNWDCELQTAVADDEVYHETIKGKFYHFRYPIKDAQQTGLDPPYVVIATTRPETMLGDTAVAVNPNDERYKHLVGKTIMLPLMNREIPIIADEWADPELGSGCVKITPAHDPNDYEVWQRHPEIGCINILNPDGTINENGNSADGKHKYAGMDRFEARKAVLRDLEALEMVDKIEDHKHDVGHSDRSKSQIEPYLSDQWFLSMGDLDNANDKEPQASACAIPQSGDEAVQPDDKEPQALACATVEWDSDAWLLTWTTYGSWLPGDEKGFVSRRPKENGSQTISNLPETPYDTDFPEVQTGATKKMGGERVDLTADQAQVAFQCIADVCERHRINPLAIAVMSDHVHILCQAEQDGSALLQLFKGNTSKVLSERWKLISAPRWWTKSGSKRHLRRGDDFTAAIEYVGAQANPLLVWTAGSGIQGGRSHRHADIAQAEASGSLATRGLASMALEAVENGSVRFFPERYKKTYIDWLSEKRDWCISRQLWWGHRIPAWINIVAPNVQTGGDYRVPSEQRQFIDERRNWILENVSTPHCGRPYVMPDPLGREGFDSYHNVVCFNGEPTDDERRMLRGWGYSESADVLDTWFSSALWPHSTLGWPGGATEGQGAASFSLRDCSRTDDAASNGNIAQAEACGSLSIPLLDYYYPTSVLITSRDIITLWVVRMVLTGLYNVGQKPFHEVYIHPKILDGRGVTMSKSKGNGVDPLDIIEVFGADALRFGIAAMTTETQDIRTPVEYRCPHCQKLTPQTPKNMFERGSTPTKVLACKHCNKEFATRWADEAVQQEKGLALMVSDKFEAARNFTNKLWNAARFAFMNLAPDQREDKEPQASACAIAEPPTMLDLQSLSTEDRWILAELSEVIRRTHDALRHYQFSRATIGLRDFFWNCLCDWYLEMVKYRIAENHDAPTARQILAFCMDQVLRLLHPIVPFITERLWQTLNEVAPQRGLPGVDGVGMVFPGSCAQPVTKCSPGEALTIARYPPTNGYPALDDTEVCAVFHDLQSATRAVREVRNVAGVAPKAGVTVTIKTTPERSALLQAESHILKRMARIDDLTIDPAATRPDKSAITIVGALQIFVHGLIDDDRQERQRIDKATAQLDKRIKGMESKLANESYVRSAPPEVVEETRDMLAGLNAERRTVQEILELLG